MKLLDMIKKIWFDRNLKKIEKIELKKAKEVEGAKTGTINFNYSDYFTLNKQGFFDASILKYNFLEGDNFYIQNEIKLIDIIYTARQYSEVNNEYYGKLYTDTASVSTTMLKQGYIEFIKEPKNIENENIILDGEEICKLHFEITDEKLKELIENNNRILNKIEENNKKVLDIKYKNDPEIKMDDFTGRKEITWKKLAISNEKNESEEKYYDSYSIDEGSVWLNGDLRFTFNNIDNKDYIIFRFSKDLKIKVTDKISFLFEDGIIIDFLINNVPHKYWNTEQEVRIRITTGELDIFKEHDFKKWQIKYSDNPNKKNGTYSYESLYIKRFVNDYCKIVEKEVENYEPLVESSKKEKILLNTNKNCYLYLMVDTINGYHKIGISNKPEYREKTLQSEKPTIEMISNKKFPNRDIALAFEQALHKTYQSKRIRGEWFNLNNNEIEDLKFVLKN